MDCRECTVTNCDWGSDGDYCKVINANLSYTDYIKNMEKE